MKWIDTHAHYNHSKFKNNLNTTLSEVKQYVQYIVTLGTDSNSNQKTIRLIHKYDYLYGMVGFFPTNVWELEQKNFANTCENITAFMEQLDNPKIVGVGEIGLDYHWDKVGEIHGVAARELQKKWFHYQLKLAASKNMPVSMHSRNAEEDTLKVFNEYKNICGVMHCFSYGLRSADVYLNKGLYLGIGGTSTYKGNDVLRDVIRITPLDRLLLETDAPYLSPQPVRKNINTSVNIKYVIENIAKLKNISEEEVVKQTNQNAMELFKFQGY